MSILTLDSIDKLVFNQVKEHIKNRLFPKTTEFVSESEPAVAYEMAAKSDQAKCKCCGWKGKKSEAKREYFFAAHISELELFCPKCDRYLGFKPLDKND